MVFIVKIPSRSRAGTPEANTLSDETVPPVPPLPQLPSHCGDVRTTPPPRTPAAAVATHQTGATSSTTLSSMGAKLESDVEACAALAPTQRGAELDILLAPSVLHHRYVRGVDKSLIVERPERIRAVLLGIATAIGKSASDQPSHPPLPTQASPFSPVKTHVHQQQNVFDLSTPSQSSKDASGVDGASTSTSAAALSSPQQDDDDDLVARLNSLSMQANATQHSTAQARQKFRVLHSTTSLPLDPPHPAVAFAHAHSDELVTVLESAYDQAKQKRRDARTAASATLQASASTEASLGAGHPKLERETTPTPASFAAGAPAQRLSDSSAAPARTSHAAYLEYLCGRAPNHPPASHHKLTQSSPAKSIPDDSENYTSSDGEGDDAMHLSEVPEHLPQGDLYLAGPSDHGGTEGGSAEAIRHAMGACCEAVDRVVSAAASASAASPTISPLREIKVEDTVHVTAASDTVATAPAAKRAFVLSRPPGHHCSGSTPQGFCWVNNAIVAAAHGYLSHNIDRVVIFDIDLHHGNGTQNLAWRINADANKHDDARSERIAGLRAAALDRARQALGSGSGRAHANRIAKVALTEQDEAEVKLQAGPRALRLFYSSLHDIESFPCEDGDPGMIKDASTCVEGAHGQWIWNIHLDHYRSESDFRRLYDEKYKILFRKAARFLTATSATPQSTLVLISAGFDACAYEYPGMQRHGKHVPPSFYHTFARDAVHFADSHADGKLVSVLEGGYSDRALCSAALAHVTGLAVGNTPAANVMAGEGEAEYWKLENLIAVEKVAKKMAAHAAAAAAAVATSGAASTNTTPKRRQAELAPWLSLTSRAFAAFEQACGKDVVALGASATPLRDAKSAVSARSGAAASAFNSPAVGAGGRVLRDRGALKSRPGAFESATSTPQPTRRAASPTKATPIRTKKESPSKKDSPSKARGSSSGAANPFATPVKNEQQDDSMAMDTDTPTRVVATSTDAAASVFLDPALKLSQSSADMPRTSHGKEEQKMPRESAPALSQASSENLMSEPATASPIAPPAAAVDNLPSFSEDATPTSAIPVPVHTSGTATPVAHTTSHPAATTSMANFLHTSSTPQSPVFSPTPVTLVDAMSRPDQRIVDANTNGIVVGGNDPLGLDFLRGQAFKFANGGATGGAGRQEGEFLGGEEDAPGSPDIPDIALGGSRQEYFPTMPDEGEERQMPGGLGGAAPAGLRGSRLDSATLASVGVDGLPLQQGQAQREDASRQGSGSSLYPHLPSSHFALGQRPQQP